MHSWYEAIQLDPSLVPRPSHHPVIDRFQYTKVKAPKNWVTASPSLVNCSTEYCHVMLLPSRLRRKTENSRHVGVRDKSFYGNLHEMSDNTYNAFNMCLNRTKYH